MATSSAQTSPAREPQLNVVHQAATSGDQSKPPMVFVHGAWQGAWCWQPLFLDYFAKQGFDVYAVDLRGHGDSPAVRSVRWNRISHYVDDVLSVVDSLARKPILIGHSMGGFVAQHCMNRSENLAGVGLLATMPHYGVWPVTLNIARRRPLDFIKMNLTMSLYPMVSDPARAWHMLMEGEGSPDEIQEFGARLGDESYMGFLDMLILNRPKKPTTSLPVHVIAAELDKLFTVASQQATAQRYGAECHIIKGAPHNLMLSSQWREVADNLQGWIDTF